MENKPEYKPMEAGVHDEIVKQIKLCFGQHPAHRLPFDELYKGVMKSF